MNTDEKIPKIQTKDILKVFKGEKSEDYAIPISGIMKEIGKPIPENKYHRAEYRKRILDKCAELRKSTLNAYLIWLGNNGHPKNKNDVPMVFVGLRYAGSTEKLWQFTRAPKRIFQAMLEKKDDVDSLNQSLKKLKEINSKINQNFNIKLIENLNKNESTIKATP